MVASPMVSHFPEETPQRPRACESRSSCRKTVNCQADKIEESSEEDAMGGGGHMARGDASKQGQRCRCFLEGTSRSGDGDLLKRTCTSTTSKIRLKSFFLLSRSILHHQESPPDWHPIFRIAPWRSNTESSRDVNTLEILCFWNYMGGVG